MLLRSPNHPGADFAGSSGNEYQLVVLCRSENGHPSRKFLSALSRELALFVSVLRLAILDTGLLSEEAWPRRENHKQLPFSHW